MKLIESIFSLDKQLSDTESNRTSSPPPRYSKQQVNLIPKKKKKRYQLSKLSSKNPSNLITNHTSPNIYTTQSTNTKLEISNAKVTSSKINQLYLRNPAKEFQKPKIITFKKSFFVKPTL